MNRDINLVKHILIHAKRIYEKTSKIEYSEFILNEDYKGVVCFNFLQIGELAKSLSSDYCDSVSKIPWKELKGIRDKIAHGYGQIDFNKIFIYCKNEIYTLIIECQKSLIVLQNK